MQLFAWVGLCFLAAFLLRARPAAAILCVIALWFFVPTVGSYLITGQRVGPLTFHASTWLTFAVFVIQVGSNPQALRQALVRHSYLFLVLGLIFAVSFLTTRTMQSGGGMVLFIDQMVAPAIIFLLILAAGATTHGFATTLRNFLFLCASVVTGIAIWQWFEGNVIFYEEGFLTQFWFNPETQRWMGTFDQPLALSLVLCTLMPLLAGVRSLYLAIPMLALFMTGVLISQSRVGIVVASAGAIYAIVFAHHRRRTKAVVLAAIGTGFFFLLASPLALGILGRVSDDTGSTEARNRAYGIFLRDWDRYLFTGQGVTSSYEASEYAGLQTSFESSLLMYAVDIGIVFAVLYFGTLLYIVVAYRSRHAVPGLTIAGLIVVLIPHSYSGLATRSVAGIIVWTIVAMTVIAAERRTAQPGQIHRFRGFAARSWVKPKPSVDSGARWIGR
ncbi:hypothetical protein [Arthrobacter sp. TMN-50]